MLCKEGSITGGAGVNVEHMNVQRSKVLNCQDMEMAARLLKSVLRHNKPLLLTSSQRSLRAGASMALCKGNFYETTFMFGVWTICAASPVHSSGQLL